MSLQNRDSGEKLGLPGTYRDMVTLLERNRLIPKELARRQKEYVGLGNVIIHGVFRS